MSNSPHKASMIFHGHFYQPPRENPWLEIVEQQDSAAPFHDWNERITYECYAPMTMARVINEENKVESIINNFKYMNFNFGPTLMSWMEQKHPGIIHALVEADRESSLKNNGHGNAIAQAYNHMILPLANDRDIITQMRWGLREFEHRFGRKSESLWLPETACNMRTIEILISEGVKYLILSPYQAEKVRKLGSSEWISVADGTIDPSQPYRQFHPKNKDKWIDIFFYDGPVSKSLGFDDFLLRPTKDFVDKIETAYSPARSHSQLVHTAIDGETYGHHKAFGERVLAWALIHEVPKRNFDLTNYGAYLAKNPPKFEVQIKLGENGEGTSWSCSHGVRRWRDHCGCRGGGPSDWTQLWRAPLREALDTIRDRMSDIFEASGSRFFGDVWNARNDYIDVILNRSQGSIQSFLNKHQKQSLNDAEVVQALKLMEMQRNAMLMYTSCGWFFTELSGIETVQIMKYAAKAIHLAQEFTEVNLENEFLAILDTAKSNVPEYKTGRVIYEKFVRPSIITYEKVANHYAIMMLFGDIPAHSSHFCYDIDRHDYKEETYGDLTLSMGHIDVKNALTKDTKSYYFSLLRSGTYDFRCSVKPFSQKEEYHRIKDSIFDMLPREHIVEIFREIDNAFGLEYYTLQDLFLEERRRILEALSKETLEKFSSTYMELYDHNRRAVDIFRQAGLSVPEEFKIAAQYTITKRLEEDLCDVKEPVSETWGAMALPYLKMADDWGFKPDLTKVTTYLGDWISKKIFDLYASSPDDFPKKTKNIENIIRSVKRLKIPARLTNAQDVYYKIIICQKMPLLFDELEQDRDNKRVVVALECCMRLGKELTFNMTKSLSRLSALLP